MQNFKAEVGGVEFTFNTVHVRELQLFQVYAPYEGRTRRFHMQINKTTGSFYITDKAACPGPYLEYEQLLADLILEKGKR